MWSIYNGSFPTEFNSYITTPPTLVKFGTIRITIDTLAEW